MYRKDIRFHIAGAEANYYRHMAQRNSAVRVNALESIADVVFTAFIKSLPVIFAVAAIIFYVVTR